MIISVIVPVFNSESSLEELYLRLKKVLVSLCDDYEIIMVDDCSQDKSFKVMRSLRNLDHRVKIIRLGTNSGQHNATFCGFKYCQGDYIITIDDDLQHPPEEIPILMEKLLKGYDVVFGIPHQKQHNLYRNWGSVLIDKCINMIFPHYSNIKRSSFRALHNDVVTRMVSHPKVPIYMAALILLNSLKPGNVNVRHENRKYGKSNYSIRKSLILTRILLIHYSYFPLKVISILWKFVLLPMIILLIIINQKTWDINVVPLIMSIFLVFITILSTITFSVIGEYIKRLQKYTERPELPFIIDEIDI